LLIDTRVCVLAVCAHARSMNGVDWRKDLPALTTTLVTLREPVAQDLGPLVDLLSIADATRFGLEEPVSELSVRAFIEKAQADRAAGLAATWVITLGMSRTVTGLSQVRQLDPTFETAEWEITLAPSARGSGAFVEAARLTGSFAFGVLGAYRLEVRALQNGRANGALRKLGAVQEGILRQSMRRRGEYLDQVLWSILKEDWGEHWLSTAPRVH
jgi:RimJ/RimL family protein N-acetyltransferase